MKTKQNRSLWLGALAMGLVCLLAAGLLGSVGLVRGEEVSQASPAAAYSSYTVTYSAGKYGSTAVPATLTAKSGTTTLTVDTSGCVTLPATFADTVTVSGLADNQKLDCETFYFSAYNESDVKNGTLWAYSFTGWQIAGTDKKIAGETVLQPGFVIPPEMLSQYASDGSLELEAQWGKCYFIQNPYETMKYAVIQCSEPVKTTSNGVTTYSWGSERNITAVDTNSSTGPTGAWDYDTANSRGNFGNDPSFPLATVDYLYSLLSDSQVGDPYDACATVVMLTGDLDYIRDQHANFTFNTSYANKLDGKYPAPGTVTTGFVDGNGYLYHIGQSRTFGDSTLVNGKSAAGATFKSLQTTEGQVFNFYYKPFDDEGYFYSSVRFDNVCVNVRVDADFTASSPTFMGENLGFNCRLFDSERSATSATNNAHDGTHYFEATARMTCSPLTGTSTNQRKLFPFSTFRSHDCETVVLNSGYYTYLNASWGDTEDEMERHWYVGGSTFINQVYPGLVNNDSIKNIAGDVYLTVTGGRINDVLGGGKGANNSHTGNRYYRFYGDTTHAPTLYRIYGGAEDGILTGNVDIVVKNCTVGTSVCGGGMNYSATMTGNVTVSLENSTVSGDVYGGGLYGTCQGDVSLQLSDSKVTGTIYGSGRGNSNSVVTSIDLKSGGTPPDDWDTAPTGFPVRNADGSVTSAVYKSLGWSSGDNDTTAGIRWSLTTEVYALSTASVKNVQITIDDSQVQDVFGGGAFAIVNGDTAIAITGSTTVSGNVYGGGNGEGSIETVPLYSPIDQAKYKAPYPVIDGDSASFPNGTYQALTTSSNNKTLVRGTSLGNYTWSDDASLFSGTPGQDDFTGINHDDKLIYYNPAEMGMVAGNTSISISDTASVTGDVYGGGNVGAVLGSTTVSVEGTAKVGGSVFGGGNAGAVQVKATVGISGEAAITGNVYGGGYAGSVTDTVVNVTGGSVTKAIYGGGNAGQVSNKAIVNISGGSAKSTVYGGGYAGAVGATEVNITGGSFADTVYGGGHQGTVGSGGTTVRITDCDFTGRKVYGGGNEGAVNGEARLIAENVTFPDIIKGAGAYILGGGNGTGASVNAVSVTLENVKILRPKDVWTTVTSSADGAVYSGGNKGKVTGNVNLTITNSQIDANIYGGGANADVGGNVVIQATDLLNGTGHNSTENKPEYTFYGGGNSGSVNGNVEITVTDGRFDWFYGGGNSGNVGDVAITFNATGKSITDNGETSQQPYVAWCLRGGGSSGNAEDVSVTLNGGWFRRNIHIGGDEGVCNSTRTVVNGGRLGTLFGGGDAGAVLGKCYVEINKMTATFSVYGGGDQHSSRVGQTHVVINDPDFKIPSGQAIYGGSDQGWVVGAGTSTTAMKLSGNVYSEDAAAKDLVFTADSNYPTCLVEFNGGTSIPAIYGGSNGTPNGSTSGATEMLGNVFGSTKVVVSGGTVTEVYGGNKANGTISGGTEVVIKDGTVTSAYGGGNNGGTINGGTKLTVEAGTVTSVYGGSNQAGTISKGNASKGTEVVLSGGTVTNAYGGSNAGGTVSGGASLTLSGATVESAYGGNNAEGTISDGASLTVSAGTATNVFGGGNNGGTVNGGTSLTVSGGTVNKGHGGCNQAGTIYGLVQTNFTGGKLTGGLYGGGYQADILEGTATEIQVNISGSADAYYDEVWVFGGGNEADCEVPITVNMSGGTVYYVAGGCKAATCVSTEVNMTGGTVSSLWGGGNYSTSLVTGNTKVTIDGGKVNFTVRGGGNLGSVDGDTEVVLLSGTVGDRINGGGNKGTVGGNAKVTVKGGTVADVFGGGDSGMSGDLIQPATVKKNTYVTIEGGTVTGIVCGGGNRAWSTVVGDTNVTVTGGKVKGNVYGGGNAGLADASSFVTVSGGTLSGNVYGGGKEGRVDGRATVTMDGGSLAGSLYGGGQEGTVGTTTVQVLDDATIAGSLFGGGQGANATVKGHTYVTVNLNYDFQVTETPVDTTHITPSGMVHTALIAFASAEYGYIGGSIYGGGDLARVGDGTISTGGDKATISLIGKTHVTVENGQIAGSVFGGGRGIPESGTAYNFYMGAVFGSTTVELKGGLVGADADGGSVYGGGEQSRVYGTSGENACTVSILEQENGNKIAINGSVFGGGDRGESATANASVPTVYGDVSVLIQGIEDKKPSHIYFLAGLDGTSTGGGVYGDGNLCLVEGYRTITLRHFEPAEQGDGGYVKTFYSLQRADQATLYNSAVVLLGAPDLVEEDDTGLYSINRIGKLSMEKGSVIKLDQVVKYLGGISSDVHAKQLFIHDGNNGRTGTYTKSSCECTEPLNTENHTCDCLQPLTTDLINAYRNETGNHNDDDKNVVCVANGLYLEIVDENNTYGPVTGLFTLQLLYANPGEGGGFVYGSLPDSTGDFICETMSWKFSTVTVADEAAFNTLKNDTENGGLFVRVKGKAFQRPETYSATETYYVRSSTDGYMEIIDDVGGVLPNGEDYTYYYWYIGGPSVAYQVELTGYIGAANTEFATNTSLPQHDSKRGYVLHSASVNTAFEEALAEGTFELVQTSAVTGQQIAIELRLGSQSLGYLVKIDENTWGIQQGDKKISGYNGAQAQALDNVLLTTPVTSTNDRLTWVLHKSNTVSSTAAGLEVYLDIDLFEAPEAGVLDNVTTGTAMLSYTTEITIVRMTASQALYHDNLRSYTGVATSSAITITGNSCFTAEYQTRYVPAAYPGTAGSMVWALTTQSSTYYMSANGMYFTVNSAGQKVNLSEGLTEDMLENGAETGTFRLKDNHEVIFSAVEAFSANALPKNTKITMVDLSGDVPAYYYYICNGAKDRIDLTQFMVMGTKTTIAESGGLPAFMEAYSQQGLAVQAERLLFVFDFEQAEKDASQFTGGVTLAHMYNGVDIMDYAKQDATGANVRSFPKEAVYKFHGGQTGVVGSSYTAVFPEDSYADGESAVLRVHVQEDENWINTLFRENGFALKIQLVDKNGAPLAMPAGMYFEYKGQKYYPGADSTYIAVPVYEFGDHEITMHNPYFSLRSITGDTAYFKTSYFSAPDAGYYNAFDTGVSCTDSYSLTALPSYHLKVVASDTQVLAAGDKLKFSCNAYTDGSGEKVTVTALIKTGEGYVKTDLDGLFASAADSLSDGAVRNLEWAIGENAQPGTYRLVFTYGDHTEYLNLIVK